MYASSFCFVGKEALALLGSGASPHVQLAFRNKEPDFAWIPADLAAVDAAPSVVLEVAVFNEDEIELLNVGSEWLDLPEVQVGPLISRLQTSTTLVFQAQTLPLLLAKVAITALLDICLL